MAHFAEMNGNKVINVIAVDNEDCGGGEFPESESVGQSFIAMSGITGAYLQTSYNNNFRGLYAGKDFTYDPDLDIFIASIIEEVTE